MAEHNVLGKWGEEKAVELLLRKGYVILERDWKYGRRDLDVVAAKENVLAVIEVKTRRDDFFMRPQQAVTRAKIRQLSIAANAYVKLHGIDAPVRFDIIAVTGRNDEDMHIEHIEGAFLPLV